ncbi:MAG: D-alanyl-D-alanine carboxypeptidase family protein, partial [Candidatus Paceibacterota bacterium]
MKNFSSKFFSLNLLAILLIGIAFFGFIKYVDFKFNLIEKQFDTKFSFLKKEFETKIQKIQDNILGTKTSLTDVINQTQEKNNSLENQFSKITDTVGTLEKLSTTDPELLKKYSKVYFLNEHYVPISLTDIDSNYIYTKSTNIQIHSDVFPHLEKLLDANKADSLSLQVLSAYRSFTTQTILKDNYKITYGAGANKFSADQGYSEHQLGTTVDFTTEKLNGSLIDFDKTPEYTWLLENAYKYGFIISYPAGNTYYKFEP